MLKKIKDNIMKFIWGSSVVPVGLYELADYFVKNKSINFQFKEENGCIIAKSLDFKHGVILTSGRSWQEVDRNIKDAILTAFSVPSSYAKEANIHKVDAKSKEYAIA